MFVYVYGNHLSKSDSEAIDKALEMSGFSRKDYSIRDIGSYRIEIHPFMIVVGESANEKIYSFKSNLQGVNKRLLELKLPSKMDIEEKFKAIEAIKDFRAAFLAYVEECKDQFQREQLKDLLKINELVKLRESWDGDGKYLKLKGRNETYHVYAGDKPGTNPNEYTFEEIMAVLGAMVLLGAEEARIVKKEIK